MLQGMSVLRERASLNCLRPAIPSLSLGQPYLLDGFIRLFILLVFFVLLISSVVPSGSPDSRNVPIPIFLLLARLLVLVAVFLFGTTFLSPCFSELLASCSGVGVAPPISFLKLAYL